MTPSRPDVHHAELRRFLVAAVALCVLGVSTYLLPAAAPLRPWVRGEPIPLVRLLTRDATIEEGDLGVLVETPLPADDASDSGGPPESSPAPAPNTDAPPAAPPVAAAPRTPAPAPLAPAAEPPTDGDALADAAPPAAIAAAAPPRGAQNPQGLANRPPAVATALEVPPGSLDAFFTALARVQAGEAIVARALHWGDSTIAADGLTSTVRARLQSRFGDAGPGFLAVHVDKRWASRPNVVRVPKGNWKTRTITFGGSGSGTYGLAGTVSTAVGGASSVLAGHAAGEDARQLLHTFDVHYQLQPSGGTLTVTVEGQPAVVLATAGERVGDAFHRIEAPAGARRVTLTAGEDGPVTVYGVALEAAGPGVTWESFGVQGAGPGSMMRQGKGHLSRQIGRRDASLLVYQVGGNELGLPALTRGGGTAWKERYGGVLARLRAGEPGASCLVITPLDQAERDRGEIRSKPALDRMIELERQVAWEQGCAFWDARAAMGGKDSFARWLGLKLAWTDLYHLTGKGLTLIGNTFADALLDEYERWHKAHPGAGRAVAAAGG